MSAASDAAAGPGHTGNWVLHMDLDQFIAAVEMLRRPELRDRPVVVGGDGDPSKRGVVATASYPARACGVHSGLPLRTAARRCPQAVFLPVDRPAYEAVLRAVLAVLRDLPAVVEVLGWDEAFLAVRTDDPEAMARDIQRRVRAATRLDCSVGIGRNKLQAKIATGFGKPAGVFRLTGANWTAAMAGRPPDALWGIGRKTARRLSEIGIATVADLARADPAYLADVFGPATGPWLVARARGVDPSPVTDEPYQPRSHGREVTFQQDIAEWERVRAQVRQIARRVAGDLASQGRLADRVVVKVRYAPFVTRTHGLALPVPSASADVIETAAVTALDEGFGARAPVRLLGVRAEFGAAARSDGPPGPPHSPEAPPSAP
ncbi:MAG: DNA polymerase IV [Streptosporangiaceae bacterium]